ncbi:hypothetical protein D3C81_1904850 [compost metagenome]
MTTQITIFPISLSFGVKSRLRPAVANADVVSKRRGRNSLSSSADKAIAAEMTRNSASQVCVIARNMAPLDRRLRKNTISSLPRIMAYIAPSNMANTVTLIPPPVEPGAAPINMSIIRRN